MSWAPDSEHLAVAGSDGWLTVIDAVSGTELHSWQCADTDLRWCGWSPDAGHVAAISNPGTLSVWNEKGTKVAEPSKNFTCKAAVWTKPRELLLLDPSGSLYLLDLQVATKPRKLAETDDKAVTLAANRTGEKIAIASHASPPGLYSVALKGASCEVRRHPIPVTADKLSVSDDGDAIAFTSPSGEVWLLSPDATAAQPVLALKLDESAASIGWNPQSNRLVMAKDKHIEIADARFHTTLLTLPLAETGALERSRQSWWNGFATAQWSPDGRRIAALSESPRIGTCKATILHVFVAP